MTNKELEDDFDYYQEALDLLSCEQEFRRLSFSDREKRIQRVIQDLKEQQNDQIKL